jgi:DNA-binding FadR family transcriptional regulator
MPITSIEPNRLYRRIAEQLRALIESGEYPVGTRLPPERDLAAQLGVSRPSVREALIALEVAGLVEIRVGSGIYARTPDTHEAGIVLHNEEGPFELIRARALIEPEIAAAAARNLKRSQLDPIRATIGLMEADAAAGRIPTAGDRLFHVRIAEAADNSVLVSVVGQLFDGRSNPLFVKLADYFENPKSWAAAIAEHRKVLDALAARDPDAARDAMRAHMQMSHKRFAAGWPEGKKAARVPAAAAPRKSHATRAHP